MGTVRGILGRTESWSFQVNQTLAALLNMINGKANLVHTHEISQVNNLQATLDDIVSTGGGLTAYVHDQPSASNTWTINHNKGYNPQVETYTVGGVQIIGDVLHATTNQVVVTFASAESGFARLV